MDIVEACDNFSYQSPSELGLLPFCVHGHHVGWLRPEVRRLLPSSDWTDDDAALERLLLQWRAQRLFPDVLDGWRDERYPVYKPGTSEVLVTMERAATTLFGVPTYGVHMTAHVLTDDGVKIWVPQRASTKQTWPGYYDNTVAGGITAGDDPFETLIRECEEEAGLDPALVRQQARFVGVVSYTHWKDSRWIQPETQYCYDLEVRDVVVPRPNDGEVDHFRLLSLDEIDRLIAAKRFKPNCAMVLLDWKLRHGLLKADHALLSVIARMHRTVH